LVLPEGYYAFPKRIVKALEAMKHQKGMKKGFSLGLSMCSVASSDDVWAFSALQLVL
jgi:hypothetical protein